MNKDKSLDEQVRHVTWGVLLAGTLFHCCERAAKEGYQVEKRLLSGFLLRLPSSPHYASLMPMTPDDIRRWELISWSNYKPSGSEERLQVYSNHHD